MPTLPSINILGDNASPNTLLGVQVKHQHATLTGHSPVLLVRDIVASAAHYRDILGFEDVAFYGEPPNFWILQRDNLHLMLGKVGSDHDVVPHWRVVENMCNVYFWVDDVEALFQEFSASGAKFDYGLCDQPYGCREFGIQDPDGYDISFGQLIDQE